MLSEFDIAGNCAILPLYTFLTSHLMYLGTGVNNVSYLQVGKIPGEYISTPESASDTEDCWLYEA